MTITLANASRTTVSVDYVLSGGTATSGVDYTHARGTVNIPAGLTTATVMVTTTSDEIDENNETFTIHLSNPVNGNISDSSGTVTIVDDDVTILSTTTGNTQISVTGGTVALEPICDINFGQITQSDQEQILTGTFPCDIKVADNK